MARPAHPTAATIGGRYQLLRRVGSGGSAHVWAALDATDGAEVALKLPRRDGGPEGLAGLRTEAAAAHRVRHPNVVRVLDHDDGAQPYLALELARDETLRHHLERDRLPVAGLTLLASDLLRALGAIHDAGLAHGDVKPTNVLQGLDGRWKLSDLGEAAPLAPVHGVTSVAPAVRGTAGYLAPERWAGRPATIESDLFALAVVLHEAATGALPAASVVQQARPRPTSQVLKVGDDSRIRTSFAEALSPALATDPLQRPSSAHELAGALDHAMRTAFHAELREDERWWAKGQRRGVRRGRAQSHGFTAAVRRR
jgi:serine/threonine-protein kinase